MSDDEEKVLQARIQGSNYGYDTAVAIMIKKVQALHDVEFNKLTALFKKKATDEQMLKLTLKTHEVMQLEKVLEILEGMK